MQVLSKVSRNLKKYFSRLVSLDDTPERIALAFATGVFVSFSPLLGLHTLLGLTIGFFFGLNRIALLTGLFLNTPWTIVPFYTLSTWLGSWILGFEGLKALPHIGLSQLFRAGFWMQLIHQWPLLIPMSIGSALFAAGLAILAYVLALYLIRRGRAYLKSSKKRSAALFRKKDSVGA